MGVRRGVVDVESRRTSGQDGSRVGGDPERLLALVDLGDRRLAVLPAFDERFEHPFEDGPFPEDGLVRFEILRDPDLVVGERRDQFLVLPFEEAVSLRDVDQPFGLVRREPVAIEGERDHEGLFGQAIAAGSLERGGDDDAYTHRWIVGVRTPNRCHLDQTRDSSTRRDSHSYMQYQGRSRRTKTGARARPQKNKKKHELGRSPTETELDEPRFRVVEARGGTRKIRALSTNVANVTDGGETVHAAIEDVVENTANPNYVRRNILTKGAVIETDEGTARVTSRPGQTGQVNAVLTE